MKILLSAYACEPGKGSEPGVGWNWARTLAQMGHQVHVITRSNNRPSIEKALHKSALPMAMHYFDLPRWMRWWKRGGRGLRIYYVLWQVGAYRQAKRLLQSNAFDRVQHVTFASFRQPTFLGTLGIPLTFGPVGGGETMPRALLSRLPLRYKVKEYVRQFANLCVEFDPIMRSTFARAAVIACATPETLNSIPVRHRGKCIVLPAIGSDTPGSIHSTIRDSNQQSFLYVGRLLYWKGIHLALRALARVHTIFPEATLTIVGEGDSAQWLREISHECKLEGSVRWVPWMDHESILQEYGRHTALVFPSLHDSGGMVVLEALARGCPVICLNLGGPGQIVNSSCGAAVEVAGLEESAIIERLAQEMIRLAQDPSQRAFLRVQCQKKAEEHAWRRIVESLYPSDAKDVSRHGANC